MNRIRISLTLALFASIAALTGCAHDHVYIRYEERCSPPPPRVYYYCPPPPPRVYVYPPCPPRHIIVVPPHHRHHR